MLAPLVNTPHHHRLVALGCFGVAASLPCLLIAQFVAQAYFHKAEIFWEVDPSYLLGAIALLFTAGVSLTCVPFRRVDGSHAQQPLRGLTLALAFSAPAA